MSVIARVFNKDGAWFEWSRACFGFLSYIDRWEGCEVEGTSLDEDKMYDYDEGIDGFESGNISHIVYKEYVPDDVLRKTIQKALAGLPQYYGDVTVTETGSITAWQFEIPIAGKPMASTVIGCMMLRNILAYSGYRRSYIEMVEGGVEPSVAFIAAQAYAYRHDALKKDRSGWYRNIGGDDCIFSEKARLCDLIAAVKGEIGDDWQGKFGETANGYGRYNEYDEKSAPRNKRTSYHYNLCDVTLVKDGWENSPRLNDGEKLGGILEKPYNTPFWPRDEFFNNLIPLIKGETK